MAMSLAQLFDVFAARAAEILRGHYGMDPAPLLRVRPAALTIEGLVLGPADGGPVWHLAQVTRGQLEARGPEAAATAFVRDYVAAVDRARRDRPGAAPPGPRRASPER